MHSNVLGEYAFANLHPVCIIARIAAFQLEQCRVQDPRSSCVWKARRSRQQCCEELDLIRSQFSQVQALEFCIGVWESTSLVDGRHAPCTRFSLRHSVTQPQLLDVVVAVDVSVDVDKSGMVVDTGLTSSPLSAMTVVAIVSTIT